MDARNFGLVMMSLLSIRTQSHSANAPVFVRREITQSDAFRKTTEMLMKTRYKVNINMYSLDMSINVERRERDREKENKKAESST